MIHHEVEQGSEAWFDLRLGKVTSSNAALFMANLDKSFGDPAKRYALQIALEQVTGKKSEFSFSNAHTERGIEFEPMARAAYEQIAFTDVQDGGFFDHGTHGASPDGLVDDDGLIEIKSVIASTHYATLMRNSYDPAYKWQLISNLEATDSAWIDFISYCPEFPPDLEIIIHRLHRKDCSEEIRLLRKRRNDFLILIQQIVETLK